MGVPMAFSFDALAGQMLEITVERDRRGRRRWRDLRRGIPCRRCLGAGPVRAADGFAPERRQSANAVAERRHLPRARAGRAPGGEPASADSGARGGAAVSRRGRARGFDPQPLRSDPRRRATQSRGHRHLRAAADAGSRRGGRARDAAPGRVRREYRVAQHAGHVVLLRAPGPRRRSRPAAA